MESLLPRPVRTTLLEFASIARTDELAELECKVLAGQIQTKDVSDRIVATIEGLSTGTFQEQHRAIFSYADGKRVVVVGPENIHKVCTTDTAWGVG